MKSTLYNTLVEMQALKKSIAMEALESSTTSGELKKKRAASSTAASTADVETSSKRPRRTCVGKNTSYDEYKEAEDENCHEDEKKTNDGEILKIDLTASLNNDSKLLPVGSVVPLPASSVIRLEQKKFDLVGKKRKDLVSICKSEGIDCTGIDGDLKDRIKRFSDYWRSECDREVQKSKAQMLSDFRRQEAMRSVSDVVSLQGIIE
jgi:hypothetical protein